MLFVNRCDADQAIETYDNGTQILTAVGAIEAWVRTGVRPTAASFPAVLGFVPGFAPPPMLQP